MRDRDVRERLSRDLRERHPEEGTLFVDELDLGELVRVDIAAVNGSLWGYEIVTWSTVMPRSASSSSTSR